MHPYFVSVRNSDHVILSASAPSFRHAWSIDIQKEFVTGVSIEIRRLVPVRDDIFHQLLPVGGLAHPSLKVIGLHVHLHKLPKGIQLHIIIPLS